MHPRAAVAMSGGVDSSTAVRLLQEQGYDLTGITMVLFPGGEGCGEEAALAARQLGIPHHVLDLSQTFRQEVMDNFVRAYEAGRTPNPCVVCNRKLKFGALLDKARDLDCDKLATGHYVRVEEDRGSGRFLLKKALRPEKDQSYVLYSLTQEQLSRSLFPLGGLSKEEVRALAQDLGLTCAQKGESQDICFIPDGDYAAFIRRYTGRDYPAGPFVNEAGQLLGEHTGIIGYTVGQRRGLGVSSNQGRLYVKEVRPADNTVVLSDNQSLFARALTARQVNWIACGTPGAPLHLRAKIRYRMTEQPCTVEQTGPDQVRVVFDQPQRAVTPGQAVVFYDGDTVVGGAAIEKGESL